MIGSRISHYRLVEKLGEGGMGEVWVADDETLHRRVALKAIRADRRLEPGSRARFLREARILSQLDHPHICRIFDYVEEGGHDYLVLELVAGQDLRAAIGEGIERSDVLDVLTKVDDALAAAHAAGVVHRDLKPANVMLTPDRGVKVLDFGLAATADTASRDEGDPVRPRDPGDAGLDLTEDGATVGTLRYMSPEQARGEPATAASDMYAFGLMLVELITGRSAFPLYRDLAELLAHVQRGAEVSPAIRSSELGRLAVRLLDPAPSRRPTALDVASELRWIQDRPRRLVRRALLVTLVVVAVLVGVKYTADLDAERERAVAERSKAEDLVDYMLGDLRETLVSVGRLDALGGTADQVLAYLASRVDGVLGDADAFRRARALLHIGQVRSDQGRFEDALPLFEEAHEICARLRAVDPANGEWALSLGASVFSIASVAWARSDLDRAEELFIAYHDLAEELVAQDPGDVRFQTELGYAHTNMTAVHMARGDSEAAIQAIRDSVEIKRTVCGLDPTSEARQRDLATGLSWLSESLYRAWRFDEALEHRREEFDIRRELALAGPKDTDAQRLLSISLQRLGFLLGFRGQDEAARGLLVESVEVSRRLVGLEPTNADWQRGLAVSQRTLAAVQLRLGELEEATLLIAASRSAYEQLTERDPSNLDSRRGLAAIHSQRSALLLALDEPARALDAAQVGLAIVEECRGSGDESGELAAVTGRGLLYSGVARRLLDNDDDQAQANWARALTVLEPFVETGGKPEPEIIDAWVRSLVRLRRIEEAEPHARRLLDAGYARRDFVDLCARLGWK